MITHAIMQAEVRFAEAEREIVLQHSIQEDLAANIAEQREALSEHSSITRRIEEERRQLEDKVRILRWYLRKIK